MSENEALLLTGLIILDFWAVIAPLFMAAHHHAGMVAYGLVLGFGVLTVSSLGLLRRTKRTETFIFIAAFSSLLLMIQQVADPNGTMLWTF